MCGDSQGTTKSWGRGESARESNGAPSKRTDLVTLRPREKRPTEQVPASSSAFLSGASHSGLRAATLPPATGLCTSLLSAHSRGVLAQSLSSLILSLVTFVISFGCSFTFLCGSLINTCFPHKITAPRAQGLCLFSLRTQHPTQTRANYRPSISMC